MLKKMLLMLAMGVFTLSVVACEKADDAAGDAGAAIEDAADDVKDAAEDGADAVGDAADDAVDAAKDAME